MNKSKKTKLLALLGVLLLVCAITFAISRIEEKKEVIKNSDEIILNIASDSVTGLSWEYEDVTLSFHKDEKWQWDDDASFPVDEEKIASLLELFEEFGVSFRIEDVDDYSQYGLNKPEAVINITAEDTSYEVKLGEFSTMDSERYVSIGDGNVYLVTHDPLEDYTLTIEDLILDDEIPEISEATSLSFEGGESYTISYEEDSDKTYCAEDVYFTDGKPLDTFSVENYLSTVSALSTETYVSYNVTEEELASFGLDNPELTVSLTYPVESEDEEAESASFTFCVGRNQEELEQAKESDEEGAEDEVTAYFRVGESQIVYELTNTAYNSLMKSGYNDLRHKEIVTASFEDIYQIDLSLEGNDYTLISREPEEDEKEDDDDENTVVWDCGDMKNIDVSDIQSAISALYSVEFTDNKPKQKEEVSFTLYLNNEKYPEINVSLYRQDGDTCLAQLDGKTIALVSRSSVVDLIEAVNAIVLGEAE